MTEWFRIGGRWTLVHPSGQRIENLDDLITGVAREIVGGATSTMQAADFDLLVSELYAITVAQAARFEARPGIVFRPWLYQRLRQRGIDFLRQWHGRKGEKRPHDIGIARTTILDRRGGLAGSGTPDEPVDLDPVGGLASESPGDREELWADAVRWLYDRGDRDTLRAERELGLGKAPRAAGGDRPAGARPGRPRAAAAGAAGARAPWADCPGCGWRHYRDASGGPAFPSACNGCGRVLTAAEISVDHDAAPAAVIPLSRAAAGTPSTGAAA